MGPRARCRCCRPRPTQRRLTRKPPGRTGTRDDHNPGRAPRCPRPCSSTRPGRLCGPRHDLPRPRPPGAVGRRGHGGADLPRGHLLAVTCGVVGRATPPEHRLGGAGDRRAARVDGRARARAPPAAARPADPGGVPGPAGHHLRVQRRLGHPPTRRAGDRHGVHVPAAAAARGRQRSSRVDAADLRCRLGPHLHPDRGRQRRRDRQHHGYRADGRHGTARRRRRRGAPPPPAKPRCAFTPRAHGRRCDDPRPPRHPPPRAHRHRRFGREFPAADHPAPPRPARHRRRWRPRTAQLGGRRALPRGGDHRGRRGRALDGSGAGLRRRHRSRRSPADSRRARGGRGGHGHRAHHRGPGRPGGDRSGAAVPPGRLLARARRGLGGVPGRPAGRRADGPRGSTPATPDRTLGRTGAHPHDLEDRT